jgi:hypothetical protein
LKRLLKAMISRSAALSVASFSCIQRQEQAPTFWLAQRTIGASW